MHLATNPPSAPFPKPNWEILPGGDLSPFWQVPLKRRITALFLSVIGVAAIATLQLLPNHFKLVVAVACGSIASALALLTLPKRKDDIDTRHQARKDAGSAIENKGDLLPFPQIRKDFLPLFKRGILTLHDFNLLIKEDLAKLDFQKFVDKHTYQVLKVLDQENKAVLVEKFCARRFAKLEPINLLLKPINELKKQHRLHIPREQVVISMLSTPEHLERIAAFTTFEDFQREYGLDVLQFLPDSVKSNVLYPLFEQKIFKESASFSEGLTVKRFDHLYKAAALEFGQALYDGLKAHVIAQQNIRLITPLKVFDYAHFKKENGFEALLQMDQVQLKELFLRMPTKRSKLPEFEQDRMLFNFINDSPSIQVQE